MPRATRYGLLGCLALCVSLGGGCGNENEDDASAEPPREGRLIFALSSGVCASKCYEYSLFELDDGGIELRAHDNMGGELSFVGRSQADLKPEILTQLQMQRSEAAAGLEQGSIDPDAPRDCPWIPESSSVIHLDESSVGYGTGCPPPGLEALDALSEAITMDLMGCYTTLRVSPRIGCESLSPFPELGG